MHVNLGTIFSSSPLLHLISKILFLFEYKRPEQKIWVHHLSENASYFSDFERWKQFDVWIHNQSDFLLQVRFSSKSDFLSGQWAWAMWLLTIYLIPKQNLRHQIFKSKPKTDVSVQYSNQNCTIIQQKCIMYFFSSIHISFQSL